MAELVLKVNDRKLKLGTDASPLSIDVRYGESRTLRIEARRSAGIRLYDRIELLVDGVARFAGRVVDQEPSADLGDKLIWTGQDYVYETDAIRLDDYRSGSAAYELSQVFAFNEYVTLDRLLTLVESVFRAELEDLGAINAGQPVFVGQRAGTVGAFTMTDGTFGDLLTRIAQAVPGYRWVWKPDVRQFNVVNVFRSPIQALTIAADNLSSLPLTRSIRNRYSRVRLVGPGSDLGLPSEVALDVVWDSALEAAWHAGFMTMGDEVSTPQEVERQAVFRRFSFERSDLDIDPNQPVDLRQYVCTGRNEADQKVYRWVSVKVAEVDWENCYVWSEAPCLAGAPMSNDWAGNANAVGRCKPPLAMKLACYAVATIPGEEVEVGPDGSAYHEFGLDRTLIIRDVDKRELTPELARLYLDAYKDVIISGRVPIIGDVPAWLWNLDCRVNIVAPGRQLGTETMRAVVTGFSHDFGGNGETVLEFGTDMSSFIGKAAL